MSDQFPVYVEANGQRVRVGTAVRDGDGFTLQLGSLSIGGTPVAAAARAAPSMGAGGGGGGDMSAGVLPNYGRSKGMPVRGASLQDLEFYINGAKRTLSDPSKERFHGKERTLLAQLEAEVARQGGGGGSAGGGPDDYGPPPPGDEDAPF